MCFAARFSWTFSLLCVVKLCKLFWQAFLWGRTIKHCAIKLRLDVYGAGLKMAIKSEVKKHAFLKVSKEKIRYATRPAIVKGTIWLTSELVSQNQSRWIGTGRCQRGLHIWNLWMDADLFCLLNHCISYFYHMYKMFHGTPLDVAGKKNSTRQNGMNFFENGDRINQAKKFKVNIDKQKDNSCQTEHMLSCLRLFIDAALLIDWHLDPV